MIKRLKAVLAISVLVALAAIALIGCSFGGGSSKGSTSNRCYIIKSDDFYDFQTNMLSTEDEKDKKDKSEYTVPAVDEMTIGETYYIVGYTKASTSDGSALEFKGGEFRLRSEDSEILISDVLEVNDYGSVGGAGVHLGEDSGSMVTYNVEPYSSSSEAQFIVFLEVVAKAEFRLSAEYYVGATVKENTYGAASKDTAAAIAYYPKKINLSDLSISYLTSEAYGDGRYDTASLTDSVEMKVGREYFMVITAKIRSLLTESNNETLTLNVNVSPLSVVDGTLEEAGSGQFDESKTDTDRNISVRFKIPEPDEGEKPITFIVKLTPVSLGSPSVKVKFSATEISILGNQNKTEKTLLINGEEKTSEGFEYTLSADKSYYILTDLGVAKGSIFLIPDTYDGKPVKEIADRAFKDLKNIKSIEISEGIERIGSYAFQNCTSLLTVKFPSTASLGSYVLSGCNAVTTLTANLGGGQLKALFGSSNTSVPTALKSVTLVGDTILAANAFAGGSKIESVSLPATLTTVSTSALSGCTSLTSLTLDSQNQSLFVQCGILYEKTSLTVLGHVSKFTGEMTYPAGVTTVPGGDMTGVTSIILPDSVVSFSSSVTGLAPKIAEGPQMLFGYVNKANLTRAVMTSGTAAPSFSGAEKLVTVSLPSTVTSIAQNAFNGCAALKNVTLPSGIKAIPYGAFSGCKALTSVNIPSGVTSIGGSAFKGCESLTTISIPSGVTSIGSSAFESCKKLKTVTLPSIGHTLPSSLFAYCEALTSVNIPAGVQYIESSAFSNCKSLTAITLSEEILSIETNAFYKSGLKTVNLSANVNYIGSYAFSECGSLTAFTVDGANTAFSASGGILYNANGTKIVQVPSAISGKVTLSNTLTVIYARDFSGCTKITELVIPGSVGCVEPGAFTSCTNLNSIKKLNNYGSTTDRCMTYNSSKRQMGYVSWDDSGELATLMKRTYPDRYFFGTP